MSCPRTIDVATRILSYLNGSDISHAELRRFVRETDPHLPADARAVIRLAMVAANAHPDRDFIEQAKADLQALNARREIWMRRWHNEELKDFYQRVDERAQSLNRAPCASIGQGCTVTTHFFDSRGYACPDGSGDALAILRFHQWAMSAEILL